MLKVKNSALFIQIFTTAMIILLFHRLIFQSSIRMVLYRFVLFCRVQLVNEYKEVHVHPSVYLHFIFETTEMIFLKFYLGRTTLKFVERI
jgi:hypothetical protein